MKEEDGNNRIFNGRKKEMRKEGKGRRIGKYRRKGEIGRNIKLERTKGT